jgi:hypothetical protein
MTYRLLASVVYRSLVPTESNWDLLVLVVLGGITASVYQGAHNVLSRRSIIAAIVAVVIAGLFAVSFVLIR